MKKYIYVLLSVLIIILAACSKKEEVKVEKEEEPQQVEKQLYVTPFTGELVEQEITMRPIIATINNHPQARPQSGLASADVVYEMLAEGDITRFLALYQSELPSKIGPIRSARSYFIEIAKGLDAFYIAHGYSPEAQMMLQQGIVDHINGMQYDGTFFQRSSDRVAPHNSYISGENVKRGAEKVNASLLYKKKVSYTYYAEDEEVTTGNLANEVTVNYSSNPQFNSLYNYDATTNKYSRTVNGIVTTDANTNEPIQLSNILVFEMNHSIIDNKGRREIDIFSGGKAYLFQAGIMREVQWKNVDGVLKAVEQDGSEVKLVPGKTWIHFIPTNPGIVSSVKYS